MKDEAAYVDEPLSISPNEFVISLRTKSSVLIAPSGLSMASSRSISDTNGDSR